MRFLSIASALLAYAASSSASSFEPAIFVNDTSLHKDIHREWMSEYSREYSSPDEEERRFRIFVQNLNFIRSHNERYAAGEVSFNMSLNKHADLSFHEWKNLLSYEPLSSPVPHSVNHGYLGEYDSHKHVRVGPLASEVDWRTKGAVTPVKDQGQCGSCWSFSTTGSIEGAHAIATGKLVSLSEEQLINCVNNGQFDCNTGGDMVEAFKYVIQNGGIASESSDPYKLKDHQKCKYKPASTYKPPTSSPYVATISGYKTIPTNNEGALASAVAKQPVSVAIDASQNSFQFYHSGVYSDPGCCTNCKQSDLDHGVLVVGYGTENGKDYWLVKNSWASGWGDSGFIKIARNAKGMCGVPTMASYPVV